MKEDFNPLLMPRLKAKFKSEKGFIAIIALGIFMMLTIFGIIIQQTVVDTISSVKNMNNYYKAKDLADSTMEWIRYELRNQGPGYNFECDDANADENCDRIIDEVGSGLDPNQTIKIKVEIKGSADADTEKFLGACPGLGAANGCYVVPFPGTGSAGKKCETYTPVFGAGAATKVVDRYGNIIANLIDEKREAPQINYSCNWGKLAFGSSLTDKVAVPLYISGMNGANDVANTTKIGNFFVRVRTPCKPCALRQDSNRDDPNGVVGRVCDIDADETICEDNERYDLGSGPNDNEDNIVVQWQLTGKCGDANDECGLIQNVNKEDDLVDSSITELKINGSKLNQAKNIVLDKDYFSQDTNDYSSDPPAIRDRLPAIKFPILSLFLSEKLISVDGNVPYLEYQILTDKPIANQKIEMYVYVNVDGNVFEETLYRDEQKPLVDFAIQN